MFYRCYIKSVGGGVECEGPFYFNSEDNAIDYAYRMAIEDYFCFEGHYGITSYEDVCDCPEDYGLKKNAIKEKLLDVYLQIRESYLDYWVKEAKDENDIDEDYQ